MEEDMLHYVQLLERGYDPEDAALVTKAKYPDFQRSNDANATAGTVQQTVVTEPPIAYNPYVPPKEIPEPLGDIKSKGKQAWDYVQSSLEEMDVERFKPSRKTALIAGGVAASLLLVALLYALVAQSGALTEGTWMNDQGQRFTFREDNTADWNRDQQAQWSQSGDEMTVLATYGDTAFTHVFKFDISEDGKAMWLLPTSITDNEGKEYMDEPGYEASCSMMLKSDLAKTLNNYMSHADTYTDQAPNWCDLDSE